MHILKFKPKFDAFLILFLNEVYSALTSNSKVIKRILHVMFWLSLEAVKSSIFAKDKVSLSPVFDMFT